MNQTSSAVLDELYAVIASRRGGDPETSYTAKLLGEGIPKCAQKLGEEAVETAIAATQEDQTAFVRESADVLYHLLVLFVAMDIDPGAVYAELNRRKGTSGLEEKNLRGTDR